MADWNEQTTGEGYIRIVRLLRNDNREPIAVQFFEAGGQPEEAPDKLDEVGDKANELVQVIRRRFRYHTDREIWLRLIVEACVLGALKVGDRLPNGAAALASLDSIEEILYEAIRPQRTKYIYRLAGVFLLTVALAVSAFGWLDSKIEARAPAATTVNFSSTFGTNKTLSVDVPVSLLTFALGNIATVAGIALGVVFSGFAQNRVISPKNLKDFDPDGFSTLQRLLYVWIVATALEVLIYTEALVVGIGGINFASFTESGRVAALIGLATAISTEVVSSIVQKGAVPKAKSQAAPDS